MPYADKQKQKEYQRQWMAKRRVEYFADKTCVVCGSVEKLELDHIDPSTKVTHRIWSWSEKRRKEELAKCQPLCEDCHEKKSIIQISRPITHGHISGYRRGCRCVDCHQALLLWWRTYRESKKKI